MSKRRYYLISYPKCGRTWLRLLIGKALQFTYPNLKKEPDESFFDLTKLSHKYGLVPKLAVSHDGKPWKKEKMVFNDKKYRGTSVLFLLRDPRDVMVSFYQHCSHRVKKTDPLHFDGDLSSFIRRDKGGMATLVDYYNTWVFKGGQLPDFQLCWYENLQIRPEASLRRVMNFLGVALDPAVIKKAIEYCSFDHMKRLERSGAIKSNRLRTKRQNDPEAFKVRKGKVGGYKDYMSDSDIRYCDRHIRERLLKPCFAAYRNERTSICRSID